ncbi:MAG: cation transport regulator ChaB [Leptolyngbyaceae cyanobacterium SM1_1_3]|nr:cation transport regulator ChaB [Leptolyngbyaceae cyanobacterium SM1_1_3]NJM85421.1 cation transport regulator ChaB [Leptolyngbyaceae cyanobacterium RM2_2_21]NJN02193.1 cation transport regulator ChaB [Leptolyngbyaceae cyanobacterium RM1_1_2]NJO10346.1 cation transport regulator ChaB [Leptolyngbyaceae cyanobacterium SL_1_1]
MPYENLESLPQDVREKLPEGAQKFYMAAFNSSSADGLSEEAARKTAWNSIKISYEEGGDSQWHPKPEGGTTPGGSRTGTMPQS